ncbi:MAG: hypothetical protein ACRD3M_16235 [Thermoanaerobaculia bacterium]
MGRSHAQILAVVLALLLSGCEGRAGRVGAAAPPTKTGKPHGPAATFAGGEVCAKCHAQEEARWKGSHHDLAMQEAAEKTVLGSFENARFTHFGVTSTFFKRDGRSG